MSELLGQAGPLLGFSVIASEHLPVYPSPGVDGRRIVRHGMADILAWLGEEVGPKPGEPTHALLVGSTAARERGVHRPGHQQAPVMWLYTFAHAGGVVTIGPVPDIASAEVAFQAQHSYWPGPPLHSLRAPGAQPSDIPHHATRTGDLRMGPDSIPTTTAAVTLDASCPLCNEHLVGTVIPDIVVGVPHLRLVGRAGDQVRAEGRVQISQARVSLSIEHTCKTSVPLLEADR